MKTQGSRLVTGSVATFAMVLIAAPLAALDYTALAATGTQRGRVDLFAIDPAGLVEQRASLAVGAPLGAAVSLEGEGRDVAALQLRDGTFEVFVVGSDGGLWESVLPPNAAWSGWQSLGGEAKRVAAATSADGSTLALFWIGADDAISWRSRPSAEISWSEPQRLELAGQAHAHALAAVAGEGSEVRLFAIDSAGAPWQLALDLAASSGTAWQPLGGIAWDIAVARQLDGALVLAAVGDDAAPWLNIEEDGSFSGWQRLDAVATRVALTAAADSLQLLALDPEGEILTATKAPDAAWGALAPIAVDESLATPSNDQGPLETTFSGRVTFRIPSYDVTESRGITLGLTLNAAERSVALTSFEPITTDPFDTPFGSTTSTVTLVGGGTGTYDPASGQIDIPVRLRFDQSLDIVFVNEDVTSAFALSTSAAGGAPLERGSAALSLAASGTLEGSGVNPLAGAAAELEIAGSLDPAP